MILITGANGQLGTELKNLQDQFPSLPLVLTDVAELDITSPEAVQAFFAQYPFSACINCAAYTAVDKAESDTETASRVNALAPEILAEACLQKGAKFIHFSSDYVYHNGLDRPLREDDPCEAKSVYAKTKLDGDLRAMAVNPDALVFRTSWVYSAHGNNFVKTMLKLGRERGHLRIVYDQIGAPTYAKDLALLALQVLSDEKYRAQKGIYNYSNLGVTSWYDFALAIFEYCQVACTADPILSVEYPTPAARPPYSVLDKSKFAADFGLHMRQWRVALKECLRELGELG
jgi:dTDP-4-dehydrorhamnose reductase